MNNREAFEAWAISIGMTQLKRDRHDRYTNDVVYGAWEGYQAALASQQDHIPNVGQMVQSQAQQSESQPALKVVNGEICYQSTDDDQCYGMWCPVVYDTVHNFAEGTKFIAIPPAPEGE